MSSSHDSIDQAKALRKRMEDNELLIETEQDKPAEIEASELPPRSEVHRRNEKKKTKFRIRFPLVRLLALAFILIVCIVATYNLWDDHVQLTNSSEAKNITEDNEQNIDVYEMKDHEAEADEAEAVQPESNSQDEKVSVDVQEHPAVADVKKTAVNEGKSPVSGANNMKNPAAVQQQPSSTESVTTEAETDTAQEKQILYHKVKAGETLYRISMKYYKSRAGEEIIKKTNGLDGNGTVFTGQLLKIPVKK